MLIVAEIAQAHDGSLGNALAYIDALADVGVNAVKFQNHHGDGINKQWGSHWRSNLETRNQYWHRTKFSGPQLQKIRDKCDSRGVFCGCSAFSGEAVRQSAEFLEPDFWKVPCGVWFSGNEVWTPNDTKPVYVSHDFRTGNPGFPCVHCTPEYPTLKASDAEAEMVLHRDCVGLSCHYPGVGPGIIAIENRAQYLEYHVCWDRRQFGPDSTCSLTIDEFGELVKYAENSGVRLGRPGELRPHQAIAD